MCRILLLNLKAQFAFVTRVNDVFFSLWQPAADRKELWEARIQDPNILTALVNLQNL
jgi:hypothetical protein